MRFSLGVFGDARACCRFGGLGSLIAAPSLRYSECPFEGERPCTLNP
jgi:hypothetical protein